MATGAYRGAGRPEANYLMERLIEQAAREMKLDSAEIRRRNFIRPEQFPYKTHVDGLVRRGRVRSRTRPCARGLPTGTALPRAARMQSAGAGCAGAGSRATWNGPARRSVRKLSTFRSTQTAP
jgi:carbon-monoxide dehydrogenase large subunit